MYTGQSCEEDNCTHGPRGHLACKPIMYLSVPVPPGLACIRIPADFPIQPDIDPTPSHLRQPQPKQATHTPTSTLPPLNLPRTYLPTYLPTSYLLTLTAPVLPSYTHPVSNHTISESEPGSIPDSSFPSSHDARSHAMPYTATADSIPIPNVQFPHLNLAWHRGRRLSERGRI